MERRTGWAEDQMVDMVDQLSNTHTNGVANALGESREDGVIKS